MAKFEGFFGPCKFLKNVGFSCWVPSFIRLPFTAFPFSAGLGDVVGVAPFVSFEVDHAGWTNPCAGLDLVDDGPFKKGFGRGFPKAPAAEGFKSVEGCEAGLEWTPFVAKGLCSGFVGCGLEGLFAFSVLSKGFGFKNGFSLGVVCHADDPWNVFLGAAPKGFWTGCANAVKGTIG